jgi:hypothetical protein
MEGILAVEDGFATFIIILVVIIAVSLGIGVVASIRSLLMGSSKKIVLTDEVKNDKKRFGKSYV